MSTTSFPLLQTINDPADLRRLARADLKQLATELRRPASPSPLPPIGAEPSPFRKKPQLKFSFQPIVNRRCDHL